VLTDGFAFADKVYPSLRALAKAISGSHCRGLPLLPSHFEQQQGDAMNPNPRKL